MNIVILAAGMGQRMRSDLPKVLHPLAGHPLLGHVLDTARALASPGRAANIIVVYGYGGDAVQTRFTDADLKWVIQEPQRGTGHAVMQAVPQLDETQPTLVLYGDVPLISVKSLQALADAAAGGTGDGPGNSIALAVLTVRMDDPTGYGRIVREGGAITRIVEQKDATPDELEIREINTGILVAPTRHLKRWLANLSDNNAQREFYLTDIIANAVSDGVPVVSSEPAAIWETWGVNSKVQLAELERRYQLNQAEALLQVGVTLADPARIDVRGQLTCGRDVSIDVNCIFEGAVALGDGVSIGANCVLRDVSIAAGSRIAPFCHLDSATVGADNRIGPYARLRPGSVLGDDVHVGNFVEIKNSSFDASSKANHLAYIGDATVGARVNIGAGTITCNYDGVNKHRTVIEDDAFIGSDSQLVAPVTVGRGATLGAGTTLTRDAPPEQLTVSRTKQMAVAGWSRPVKIKK